MNSLIKLLVLFRLAAPAGGAQSQSATVLKVGGKVTVDLRHVSKGDRIPNGSVVDASAKGAYVEFIFNDTSINRLEGGRLKLQVEKKSLSVIELLKGTLFSFLKKTARPSGSLHI